MHRAVGFWWVLRLIVWKDFWWAMIEQLSVPRVGEHVRGVGFVVVGYVWMDILDQLGAAEPIYSRERHTGRVYYLVGLEPDTLPSACSKTCALKQVVVAGSWVDLPSHLSWLREVVSREGSSLESIVYHMSLWV